MKDKHMKCTSHDMKCTSHATIHMSIGLRTLAKIAKKNINNVIKAITE